MRPRLPLRTIAAVMLATAGIGIASAGTVAHLRPGERPAAGSTEAELWYAMDQAEKEIRQSPYLVRDPALQAYVEGVVCKVAGPYCRDLRVYIVDIPVFNASMAPNGATLVFTGALLRMRDEAELAVVMGHEFAHYKARHSLEGWNSAKRTTAFLNTFGLITFVAGVPIAGNIAMLGGISSLFKQSRDNEREADRIGFEAATAQGYDPQAGVRLWERLRREEKADRTHKDRAVFASHPQSEERIADIRAAAATLAPGPATTNLETFRAAMRPFQEKWLEAELSRRTYDTTLQVLTELRQDAPPESKALYTFYLGEAHRRRNRGDDKAKAAALYAEALSLPQPPAAAWREQGMLLREQGDQASALAALRRYLEAAPDAGDAALVRHYITKLETTP
ncbi:M48 family metallopeptidase [Vulcaniibacterium gelatinicum]|uniref:M48 family metallopeptidase n=1 Tax=Vulcaniibacterium gelatinicum TaxID=2598725 RepID=UPI0011CA6EB4|nr:M48 family metallopeptidase [Vulcaniibacterium gelatinicum]